MSPAYYVKYCRWYTRYDHFEHARSYSTSRPGYEHHFCSYFGFVAHIRAHPFHRKQIQRSNGKWYKWLLRLSKLLTVITVMHTVFDRLPCNFDAQNPKALNGLLCHPHRLCSPLRLIRPRRCRRPHRPPETSPERVPHVAKALWTGSRAPNPRSAGRPLWSQKRRLLDGLENT